MFPRIIVGLLLCASLACRSALAAEAAPPSENPEPGEGRALDDELKLIAEPTVTAASGRVQILSEAPSSVTVVTAEEIQRYGYLTLGELLDSVRSFYVSDDRNYSYVGVRGFGRPGDYNTRVLFLLNGHPINENVFDSAGALGPSFGIDLASVDRVEIVRGPGSAVYGTNAVFAVVNVITQLGSQVDGYSPGVLAGAHGRQGAGLTAGGRTDGGIDYRITASYLGARGEDIHFEEFDTPGDNHGWAEDLDRERSHQGSFQAGYGGWTIQGFHASRGKRVPTASFGTDFNNPHYYTRDTSTILEARYERRIGSNLEIVGRAYYDWYKYHGVYPYQGTPDVMNDDTGSADWAGEQVAVSWQSHAAHRLTLGEEYEVTFDTHLKNFDRDPYYEYVDDQRSFGRWATFLHDELKAGSRFTFSAGARLDDYPHFGGTLSPRAGAFVHFTPGSTLKMLAGTAFRAPNVYERFYVDGFTLEPPADLEPERVTSFELIYEHRLTVGGTLALSIFRNLARDLITPVPRPSGLSRFENIDEADTRGVEAEVRFNLSSGLLAYGSATYTSAEDASGDRLTNSPRQVFKGGLSSPLAGRSLFGSIEARYVGPRRTLAGDDTPAYRGVDLSVLYRVPGGSTSISATVRNLLDADNFVPGSFEHTQDEIVQPGRWYLLRVIASF